MDKLREFFLNRREKFVIMQLKCFCMSYYIKESQSKIWFLKMSFKGHEFDKVLCFISKVEHFDNSK